MKIKYLLLFSVLIQFLCIDSDFNVIYKSTSNENQFINLINSLYLEIEISFGSNEQKFKTELDLTSYCLTIPDISFNMSDTKGFNKSSSSTFSQLQRLSGVFLEKFYSGILGQDTIKLGESESINDIKFVVANDYSYSFEYSYSYLGLDFTTGEINLFNLSLLEQLKDNKIIDRQLWYLDFTNYNKGKFVIGKYPHQINNTHFKESDMYSTYLLQKSFASYRIKFDEIYYGNLNKYDKREIIEDHNEAIINLHTRLIISTYKYGQTIHNKFFSKKLDEKICFRQKLNEQSLYYYHYCYKDKVDISEMDNLNFYIRDTNMTFIFTPKDLFYEHDDYLYFLIIYKEFNEFDSDKETEWSLGLQFLQKYTLTFDRNDKIFYYYNIKDEGKDNNDNGNGKNENDESDKEQNKKNKSDNFKYIIIIILLVVVFVACVSILIFYIFKIKPRKIKVNELEEECEYETKDKGKDYLIN